MIRNEELEKIIRSFLHVFTVVRITHPYALASYKGSRRLVKYNYLFNVSEAIMVNFDYHIISKKESDKMLALSDSDFIHVLNRYTRRNEAFASKSRVFDLNRL